MVGRIRMIAIYEFRKKYNLTQRELADLIGVSDRSIQRYEIENISSKHLNVTLERFEKSAEFRRALMIVNQDRPFVKKLLNQFKLFTDKKTDD